MDYFKSVPWCAEILDNPNIFVFTPPSRFPVNENGYCPTKDRLIRHTLHSDQAIPNIIAFYSRSSLANNESTSNSKTDNRFLMDSVTLMVYLRPGINGYNGGAHGGFVATLIDEAMGTLIFQNHEVYKAWEQRKQPVPANVLNMHGLALFTATMNVRYERPVRTPQIVLVTASLDMIKGRKVYVKVEVKDGSGVNLAGGEGMWISIPAAKV